MRTDTVNKKALSRNRGARGWVDSLVNKVRIAKKDRAEALERAEQLKQGPTVVERQEQLIIFYKQYENLVEVLCDAAQYGPSPKLEAEYSELKDWMADNYKSVKKFVMAYIQFSPEDAQQSLNFNGKSADPFEALVAAPTLFDFLRRDDGSMISRINRTREALNLYGEHLRQLASRG